jgi:hypothetical protein
MLFSASEHNDELDAEAIAEHEASMRGELLEPSEAELARMNRWLGRRNQLSVDQVRQRREAYRFATKTGGSIHKVRPTLRLVQRGSTGGRQSGRSRRARSRQACRTTSRSSSAPPPPRRTDGSHHPRACRLLAGAWSSPSARLPREVRASIPPNLVAVARGRVAADSVVGRGL